MAKKKIAEETKQEFKLICTSINNEDKTIPVIVGGTVENDKWVDPHDMTSEAIQAVRDYLLLRLRMKIRAVVISGDAKMASMLS